MFEGNRYTRLDTEALFKSGAAATDMDAVMLLNHKAAIKNPLEAAFFSYRSTRRNCSPSKTVKSA
ncbi:hypothetical protein [Hydrogenophaga sp.]|uniref:hypothetical protein n=1 Tax=Hydrogenophaga sp. TaxID=1904254 RepID=UPI002717D93F|nr:hypothetical protein [Hydrogenophaga sp.]MDO9434242.1 hypothetical protein [Hydrogenophaga sp.]